MLVKLLLLTILASVHCRVVFYDGYTSRDSANIIRDGMEDIYSEPPRNENHPAYLKELRVRRQTQGNINTNPDGSANVNLKVPLAGNDHNMLSGIGSVDALQPDGKFQAAGGGLALDNINGHGLSVIGKHVPGFGNQLTGAGHANLFENDNHKLDANAFVTRNMPSIPNEPSFNTVGGGVDYMYKDRVGASLGTSRTDYLQRQDYAAMGKLNLYKGHDSSLDMYGGFSKTVSPFIPDNSWRPSAGVSFTKYW